MRTPKASAGALRVAVPVEHWSSGLTFTSHPE